jgi:trk system potassium uptake protein TrkA
MGKRIAVIGIGTFGESLCRSLRNLGNTVYALDSDERALGTISDIVDQAVLGDATNIDTLKAIFVEDVDDVVVCVGSIEDSIMITVMLKDLDVKNITVKVTNAYQERVIKTLGAKKTIFPEQSAGMRLARILSVNNILDYYDVGGEYGIYEIAIQNSYDKTILELDIRNKYDVNIIMIVRDGKVNAPRATDIFCKNDIIMVVGTPKSIEKLQAALLRLAANTDNK